MSERSWTPGPWRYDSGVFYAECQLDESGMTYERPIAEMLEGRPLDTKANARLIAVAPEMFEVLERVIDPNDHKFNEVEKRIQEIIKRVRGDDGR